MAVYSKAQLDWVLEKSVNQYGVSAYVDASALIADRQVTVSADTWTDVAIDLVEAHISGFTNGTETDFIPTVDYNGIEILIDVRVTGYASTPDTEVSANFYIDDVACACDGGVRVFKTAGDSGSFTFIASSKTLNIGDRLHMKIKADKNTTFTFERLPITISLR
jgi:hypothetical protein